MKSRRELIVVVLASLLLTFSGDSARADRLGGAYRGPKAEPETAKQGEDATEPETSDDERETPDGPETDVGGGESPTTDPGTESGSTEGPTEGPAGSPESESTNRGGHGSYRGPSSNSPPPESGGSGSGGESTQSGGESAGSDSGASGGSSAPSTGSGSGSTSGSAPSGTSGGGASAGGPTGGKFGKKGTTHADRAFQKVLWYFEQNRESLLLDVTARARDAVPVRPGSALGDMAIAPTDGRVRTPLTSADTDALFRVLESSACLDGSSLVRDAAVIALGKLGTDAAVDVLLDRLTIEKDREVRQDILLALGLSRSDRALPALESALSRPATASFALMALGLSERGTAAGAIVHDHLRALLDSDSAAERTDEAASAVVALGSLGHPDAVPLLVRLVRDEDMDEVVRVHATHAIGNIRAEGAAQALLGLLEKGTPDVRRAAALSLGSYPTPSVAKKLAGKDGLGRPDALQSGFAAVSLARIVKTFPEGDWKPYVKALGEVALKPQKDPVKSQYANLALALLDRVDAATAAFYGESYDTKRLDDDSKTALTLAAGLGDVRTHGDEFASMASSAARPAAVRSYAALALAMVSGSKSADAAKKLMSVYRGTRDPEVRRGAIAGLAIVGDRASIPFLTSVLRNPGDDGYTHGAAATSIGSIRDSGSLAEVVKLVKERNPRTRAFAVAALGCMVDKDTTPSMTRLFRNTNFQHVFPTLQVVMSHL